MSPAGDVVPGAIFTSSSAPAGRFGKGVVGTRSPEEKLALVEFELVPVVVFVVVFELVLPVCAARHAWVVVKALRLNQGVLKPPDAVTPMQIWALAVVVVLVPLDATVELELAVAL